MDLDPNQVPILPRTLVKRGSRLLPFPARAPWAAIAPPGSLLLARANQVRTTPRSHFSAGGRGPRVAAAPCRARGCPGAAAGRSRRRSRGRVLPPAGSRRVPRRAGARESPQPPRECPASIPAQPGAARSPSAAPPPTAPEPPGPRRGTTDAIFSSWSLSRLHRGNLRSGQRGAPLRLREELAGREALAAPAQPRPPGQGITGPAAAVSCGRLRLRTGGGRGARARPRSLAVRAGARAVARGYCGRGRCLPAVRVAHALCGRLRDWQARVLLLREEAPAAGICSGRKVEESSGSHQNVRESFNVLLYKRINFKPTFFGRISVLSITSQFSLTSQKCQRQSYKCLPQD